jgi:hypothetical protein
MSRVRLFASVLACSFLLTGCGLSKIFRTPDEIDHAAVEADRQHEELLRQQHQQLMDQHKDAVRHFEETASQTPPPPPPAP